jgi:hypothetical protein
MFKHKIVDFIIQFMQVCIFSPPQHFLLEEGWRSFCLCRSHHTGHRQGDQRDEARRERSRPYRRPVLPQGIHVNTSRARTRTPSLPRAPTRHNHQSKKTSKQVIFADVNPLVSSLSLCVCALDVVSLSPFRGAELVHTWGCRGRGRERSNGVSWPCLCVQ